MAEFPDNWPTEETPMTDKSTPREVHHRRHDDAVAAYHIHSRLPAPSAASGLDALAEELETAWEESGFELQNDPLSRQLDAAITRALAALRSRPAQVDAEIVPCPFCGRADGKPHDHY